MSAVRTWCNAASCLFVLLACGCQAGASSLQEQGPIDVVSYDLTIKVEPDSKRIEASVMIKVNHPDTLSAIVFNLDGPSIDDVSGDGELASDPPGDTFVVGLPGGASTSEIMIAYSGEPADGYFVEKVHGEPIIFTDNWPNRARGWLPSIDHPSDPATFSLTINAPSTLDVAATGRRVSSVIENDRKIESWRLEARSPTYSLGFAVADFAITTDQAESGIPIVHYLLPADSAAVSGLRRTPAMLDYFSDLIGPYAYESYGTVEAPIPWGGMENASLPFLTTSLFGPEPNFKSMESVQAHEAAHQWFGDQVHEEEWRDLWVSEGFATYLTTMFYEHVDGEDAARDRRASMTAFHRNRQASHGPLVPSGFVDPNVHLNWLPYQKGGSVLHIIRARMGDELFSQFLSSAYEMRSVEPTSTPDLMEIIEGLTGESWSDFFDYWAYSDKLPELRLAWDKGKRVLSWSIEGDESTLAKSGLEIEIKQGEELQYVAMSEGTATLAGSGRPVIRPVGVFMKQVW